VTRFSHHAWAPIEGCRKGGALEAAEKRLIADNHPVAKGATPPESGGEFLRNSPPQLRRGGAPSAGVVLTRGSSRGVDSDSANGFFRSLFSPAENAAPPLVCLTPRAPATPRGML